MFWGAGWLHHVVNPLPCSVELLVFVVLMWDGRFTCIRVGVSVVGRSVGSMDLPGRVDSDIRYGLFWHAHLL